MKQVVRFTRSTATYSLRPFYTSLPSHIYTQNCAHMLHRTEVLSYILKYIHESSSSSLNSLSAETASKVAIDEYMKKNWLNLFMKVSFAFRFPSLSDCHRSIRRIKGMFAKYWTLVYVSQLLFILNGMHFYRWPLYFFHKIVSHWIASNFEWIIVFSCVYCQICRVWLGTAIEFD